MSTPFRTCPVCGCNLDPGERCDCTNTPAADHAAAENARRVPPAPLYYGSRGEAVYQPEREAELGVRPAWRGHY